MNLQKVPLLGFLYAHLEKSENGFGIGGVSGLGEYKKTIYSPIYTRYTLNPAPLHRVLNMASTALAVKSKNFKQIY